MMRQMCVLVILWGVAGTGSATASGHGPVFGAATPTLGRGGWSLDQAWTVRTGEDDERPQMIKTMLAFGVTENLQVSASFPLMMSGGDRLAPARMMTAMSSERDLEALVAYRFHRRPVGIGGRQESTVYLGGTAPLESRRNGIGVGPSLELAASTGFASRAQYVWVGGAIQHFLNSGGDRFGQSKTLTLVYGYRPAILRTEEDKPDLRFFVEATAENRSASRSAGGQAGAPSRTLFLGPTSLLLYKAFGLGAGVLFPVYQASLEGSPKEHARIAVNVAYFFWLN